MSEYWREKDWVWRASEGSLREAVVAAADRIEALEAALKPFADLAAHISNEGAMMEVCRPCPENPARTILPILTKHFTRASVILREGK
jgi:hypothetical protein